MSLREAFETAEKHVGCGDTSCRFKKARGMSTNGGCRCENLPFAMGALAKLYRAVRDHLTATAASSPPNESAPRVLAPEKP